MCCLWWLLLGLLVGWLLSWLLGRLVHLRPDPGASRTGGVDFTAARAAGFFVTGDDNLEMIEGVGPAIARLLRAGGIDSFAKLARSSVPEIQGILDAAGPRFRVANHPQTWAEQANLAASNRWTELARLQEGLVGGVRRG